MSWNTKDQIGLRGEFVMLARADGASVAELCRRFGISRKTGYKWLTRYAETGAAGLQDRARLRERWSNQTDVEVEQAVLSLRQLQPTWGPRKLRQRLCDLAHRDLPSTASIARILKRNDCVQPLPSPGRCWQRFERDGPNQLLQMDFKGHFAMQRGERCHPLTVIDDYSRYVMGLEACGNEQAATVQSRLQRIFTVHGLPESILCDNGPPWGAAGRERTELTVWLLRLGVDVLHGRPHHPQTQGKIERFHRSLKSDLLARHDWLDLAQAQQRFDAYRNLFNHDRPHDALGLAVPASRYRPSPRSMPRRLPHAEYENNELVRTVKSKGEITFANRFFFIGSAFRGLQIALRPTATDGVYRACYAAFTLGTVDVKTPSHLPRGNYHPLLPYTPKV